MPHANGTATVIKEADGSRTITFREGDFRMEDNFFGGEPYGGRLTIFYRSQAVFLEVYYGKIYQTGTAAETIYDFLREALRHPGEDNPYRGPLSYKKGGLEYKSTVMGDITGHTVEEWIYENGTEVYHATVIGGLVDQHAKGMM